MTAPSAGGFGAQLAERGAYAPPPAASGGGVPGIPIQLTLDSATRAGGDTVARLFLWCKHIVGAAETMRAVRAHAEAECLRRVMSVAIEEVVKTRASFETGEAWIGSDILG